MAKDENIHIKDNSEATYDHVIKYTGLFGGVQGITMLMNIVRNKLVALLLGPEGTGIISIFNNVLRLINQSTNFGIDFSAVKYIAEISDDTDMDKISHYARIVRTTCLTTGLAGTAICFFLSYLISSFTFQSTEYTHSFMIISPAITCLSVSGGELAILKGTKQLKNLALVSVLASLSTLAICVPVYYFLGIKGVAISLLLTTASITCIQLCVSTKSIPWQMSLFKKDTYIQSIPMIKLGIGYIVAGIFGQGSEYVIRWFINNYGSPADVGLYNSGYVMAVTYASMVFIAIEADFFPRLSAAKDNIKNQNDTVNQQIEVCTLLISPFLILYVTAMPLIVYMLFSEAFLPAVPMAIFASLYMYFKALTLPAAYLSLAHGNSKLYMATELVYDIIIAVIIPMAYMRWGVTGTGLALSVAGLIDMLVIHITYNHCYKFRFSTRLLHFYIMQFLLLISVVWASTQDNTLIRYAVDAPAFIISAFMSLRILNRETEVVAKLKNRIWKRK